ncbi:MAG: SRPBCC family protein [Gemmatimonadaceae bacterium]
MKIALIALGVLVLVIAVVTVVGYTLPQKHTASREQTYAADPAKVFAAITTPTEYPAWRTGVKRIDVLPDQDGKRRFREVGSNGTITFVFDEIASGSRVVSRIADDSLPFGGKWTYELEPSGAGTKLTITEDGEVYNPIFRFMSRFVFGHHASLDAFHDDLKRRVESSAGL